MEMAENHGLQLMGGGMNNNAKQSGIEEFAGPGTEIRQRREMGRERVRWCIRNGNGIIKDARLVTRRSTHRGDKDA